MYPQPARCMHVKSSLTTAFTKLGCSYTDKKCPLYMSIKLSKLMLDPLCSNPCRVAFTPYSWHALSMCLLRSLWPALIIVNRSIETSEGQNVSTCESFHQSTNHDRNILVTPHVREKRIQFEEKRKTAAAVNWRSCFRFGQFTVFWKRKKTYVSSRNEAWMHIAGLSHFRQLDTRSKFFLGS